ncbi:hypothetical protein ACP3TD_11555 [Pseudarthrobacter sp. 1G09]|uniref:hypothetical protein n=1 Tax=Pseudarthrobacter sp. 1G09 TaxID=3416178 RepID=UPI003CEBF31B
MAMFLMQELAWFEDVDGKVIATIVVDTDDEYGAMILARDLNERFRWIDATDFVKTPEQALGALHQRLAEIGPDLDRLRVQGDETGGPIDFFSPLSAAEKLSPDFLEVASSEGFSAARGIISAMMRWNEDIDGNFVEQFQTTGFDARLWELYLFAALTEAGFSIERPSPAPDFLARGPHGEFALEATTINPSVGPDGKVAASQRPSNESELASYVQNYLPIRYAGPLTAKLGKEYWTKPAAAEKPLVFAIQDFHDTMSMTYSGAALATYLYGSTQEAQQDSTGLLTVTPRQITEHKWGQKTVQSGFFSLPGAEHVSAVIFNSSATISKFNRMGVGAGFGSDETVMIRQGFFADPDPQASQPLPYVHFVVKDDPETWIEGMDVYHNPRAKYPLEPGLLPDAAHHRLMADGRIETQFRGWKPLQSRTSIMTFGGKEPTTTLARDEAD